MRKSGKQNKKHSNSAAASLSALEAIVGKERKGKKKGKDASSRGKRAAGSLIPIMGSLAGGYLGGPTGSRVGSAAGKLISAITGFGDYRVNSNSISMGNAIPTFRQGGDGLHMCHSEMIMDIKGSVGFTNLSFPINPGIGALFPLLSLQAQLYEEYEMRGLVLQYRPSSGSAIASTNNALGVVVMATDYDAVNPPFGDKQTMESYEFAGSTVPCTGLLHPVECARKANVLDNLYTRAGAPPANTDIRLYDMGNFQIATVGQQAVTTIGELWVSYDVILRKPRLPPGFTASNRSLHLIEGPDNGMTTADPFGANGPQVGYMSNWVKGSDYDINGIVGVILYNPGTYTMHLDELVTEGGTLSTPTISHGTNIIGTGGGIWSVTNTDTVIYSTVPAASKNYSHQSWAFHVTDYGDQTTNFINLAHAGGAVTAGHIDITFTAVNGDVPDSGDCIRSIRRHSAAGGGSVRRFPKSLPRQDDENERFVEVKRN